MIFVQLIGRIGGSLEISLSSIIFVISEKRLFYVIYRVLDRAKSVENRRQDCARNKFRRNKLWTRDFQDYQLSGLFGRLCDTQNFRNHIPVCLTDDLGSVVLCSEVCSQSVR